jgi:hypothetical protein
VTTPTKSDFLAAYEKELHQTFGAMVDSDIIATFAYYAAEGVAGRRPWFPSASAFSKRAWHAIGMTGEPTIEALRRLP